MLRRLAAIPKPTAVVLLAAAMLAVFGLASQRYGGADRDPVSAAEPTETDYQVLFWSDRVTQNDLDYLSRTNLAAAYLELARTSGDLALYDTAEEPLREALALNPRYGPTLSALASVHLGRHEFPAALATAAQAVQHDPSSVEALAALGDAQLELGAYDQATQSYEALHRRLPGPESEARLARLAFILGRPDESVERASRALELAGQSAELSYYAALTAYALDSGRVDLADRTAATALARYPESGAAREGLALVRAQQGQLELAAELYEQVLDLGPDPGVHDALGDIYTRLDRADDAGTHYAAVEPAARSITTSPLVFDREIVQHLADNNVDTERAVEMAERDLLNRQDIYAYDALAWALHANGDLGGAAEASEKALATGSRDPHLLYRAGIIAAATGDTETADRQLTAALEINPNFDVIYAPHAERILVGLERGGTPNLEP